MLIITTGAPYVTLINLFRVAPEHQLGLTRVQLGDIYWYGSRQDGNVSANFHRSLDGVRVFNYGQWATPEHLAAGRATPDFEQHLRNMRFFDYTIEPTVYEVVYTTRPVLRLSARDGYRVVLTVVETAPGERDDVARHYEKALAALAEAAPAGFVAAALHRALDGTRVAEYSQWSSEAAYASERDRGAYRLLGDRLGSRTIDSHVYELAGSSDD